MKHSLRTLIATVTLCCYASQALAAGGLIRDAEIEHTLRMFGDPLFRAAGLKPSAVKIFIVGDETLNAFVAGGSNMFIHTGLIEATTSPAMLLGVMAHETGHISGGHLAKGSEKLKDAQLGSILTYVLGAAAAAASRKPEAAAAVITGGSNMVGRNFLAFTRTHENAADQAALGFLDQTGTSASGMLKVFELLQRNERQHVGARDPYLMTHPLSTERMDNVRHHLETAKIPEGQYPATLDMAHQRMVAKLYGFLKTPERTLLKYPLSNKSVPARIARAVAYYKMPDITRSMAEMDSLVAQLPKDPFIHELRGQILYENRRGAEALKSYETALSLMPSSPLILTDLAKVEIEQGDKAHLTSAVAHLEKSVSLDNTNPDSWHWLATAYGKSGNEGMSSLALAEKALLTGDAQLALSHSEHAIKLLAQSSPAYRRGQDVKARALDMKQEEKTR